MAWYKNGVIVAMNLADVCSYLVTINSTFASWLGMKILYRLSPPGRVSRDVVPIATDRKVPKNEYGNVEFFECSPALLPAGTEHVRGDQISRVASKLGLNYAPALVGFETRQGRQVPVLDGIIVCKEQCQVSSGQLDAVASCSSKSARIQNVTLHFNELVALESVGFFVQPGTLTKPLGLLFPTVKKSHELLLFGEKNSGDEGSTREGFPRFSRFRFRF